VAEAYTGLTLLMLYIYIALSKPCPKTRIEIPILILMAMGYELTCVLAIVISLIEILRLKGSARAVYLAPLHINTAPTILRWLPITAPVCTI